MRQILFMHQASSVGGGSYCLLNILKVIDRHLWNPIVCLLDDGSLRVEVEKLGIRVVFFKEMRCIPYNHSLLKKSSLETYYKIYHSIPAFKRILQENKIDVVYLNNMMLYRYLQPAKEAGCKTIMHVREHWPEGENQIQLKWAQKAAKRYSDKLIAINHYSASMFSESSDKMTIVYDWIDLSARYEKVDMDKIFNEDTSKLKIFLYTGGMQKIKGAYEVVKIFSETRKHDDERLLFMGYDMNKPTSGRKGLLKKILYKLGFDINELKVRAIIDKDKRIKCIPATYKIVDYIKQSYCMLSYFTIPHANLALAESIIIGTPVIACLTEESLEYSDNGRLANLFPFQNQEEFSNCIDSFNHEKMLKIIEKSKCVIEKLFSPEDNIERLNSVINSL